MTATTLDPRTALVVVDLQKGILALPTIRPSGEILAAAVGLAAAFRRAGLPVVLVDVAGAPPGRVERPRSLAGLPADWREIPAELAADPGDLRVTKRSWGAFTATGLEATLRERGVTQVVLAGISTSIGIETTARQAFEAGFNVTVVTDAVTDLDAGAEERALSVIFPRIGETATLTEILALLETRPTETHHAETRR